MESNDKPRSWSTSNGKKSEPRLPTSGKRPIRGSLVKRGVPGLKNYFTQRTGIQEKNKELVTAVEGMKVEAKNLRSFNDELQCENFRLQEKVMSLEKTLKDRRSEGVEDMVWKSFNLIKEAVDKVTIATDMLLGLPSEELNTMETVTVDDQFKKRLGHQKGNTSTTTTTATKANWSSIDTEADEHLHQFPACMSVPFDIFQDVGREVAGREESKIEQLQEEDFCPDGNNSFLGSGGGVWSINTNDDGMESSESDEVVEMSCSTHSPNGCVTPHRKEEHTPPSIATRIGNIRIRQRNKPTTYKEPSIRKKLRRGDPFTDPTFCFSPRPRGKRFRAENIKKGNSLRDISNAIVEPAEESKE